MSSEDEPTFEQADAGASATAPQQAGTLRKGGFVMLKGTSMIILYRVLLSILY